MSPRPSLQQIMLRTLIGALVLSALVGIWAFVFGSFSKTEIKILLTTLSVAYFSVTALGCAAAQQLGRSRLLWLPGLLASAGGFAVFMLGIWPEWFREDLISKSMAILAIFAFSFAQACLLALPRLSASVRWVFFGALAAIFCLAVLVSSMIMLEIDDEWLFRLTGVLGILDGCATLTIPILFKLGYRAPPADVSAEAKQPTPEIKLACPRCGREDRYLLGTVTCPQCGLGLRVELVEEPGYPTGGAVGRPQFRLRTMLILFLVASVFLGWLGARLQHLRQQQAIVEQLQKAGLQVTYQGGNVVGLHGDSASLGRLTPENLASVAKLSEIETVFLINAQITDEYLRYLVGLDHLESLDVSGSRITDVGLAYVASLKALRVLDLCGNPITNAGLARLAALPNLVHLELENTRVSDEGLRHLEKMPSLQFVTLTGTRVSEAGLARLRGALPHADVQFMLPAEVPAGGDPPKPSASPQ